MKHALCTTFGASLSRKGSDQMAMSQAWRSGSKVAPWQRWIAHAGVNRLPSGCASALGSSAASPASAAAVKTGAKGERNELVSAGLKTLMQCISTCRMFMGELWTQLNGQSINILLLRDCSHGLPNPYCARTVHSDSIESILIVLLHYRINIYSGFSFQNVQKLSDKNV